MCFHLPSNNDSLSLHQFLWSILSVSLCRVSFNGGPLCTGVISVSLNLARFRHSLTLPFTLESSTKLLHHVDVSSMPRSMIICCICNISRSSFRGSGSLYAILLEGAWYCQLPSYTSTLNVLSKQPIPEKTPHVQLFFLSCSVELCLLYNQGCWMLLLSGNNTSCFHVSHISLHTLSLVCLAIQCLESLAVLSHPLVIQRIYIWHFYLCVLILLCTHLFVLFLINCIFLAQLNCICGKQGS